MQMMGKIKKSHKSCTTLKWLERGEVIIKIKKPENRCPAMVFEILSVVTHPGLEPGTP